MISREGPGLGSDDLPAGQDRLRGVAPLLGNDCPGTIGTFLRTVPWGRPENGGKCGRVPRKSWPPEIGDVGAATSTVAGAGAAVPAVTCDAAPGTAPWAPVWTPAVPARGTVRAHSVQATRPAPEE